MYIPKIRQKLYAYAQILIADRTGIWVHIKDFHVDFYPPRLSFDQIHLLRDDHHPFIKIEELHVLPGIARSLSGRPAINWVAIVKPVVHLTYDHGEFVEFKSFSQKTRTLSSSLNTLKSPLERVPFELLGGLLQDAEVQIEIPESRSVLHINHIDLYAKPVASGPIFVLLSLGRTRVSRPAQEIVVDSLQSEWTIEEGHLAAPHVFRLNNAWLKLQHDDVCVSGFVDLIRKRFRVHSFLHADLAYWSRFLDSTLSLPALNGQVAVSVDLNGSLHGLPELVLRLDSSPLLIGEKKRSISHVHALLMADPSQIKIQELRAFLGDTQVSFLGYVEPKPKGKIELSIDFKGLHLETLLDELGLSNPWIKMPVDGQAKLHGQLAWDKKQWFDKKQPMLSGQAHVRFPSFFVYDRSFRNARAQTYLQLNAHQVDALVGFYPDRLEVSQAHLTGDTGDMSVGGQFYFDLQKGMQLQGSSSNLHLSALKNVATVPIAGDAHVQFSLQGPYGPPEIKGQMEFKQASIAHIPLGNGVVSARYFNTYFLDFEKARLFYGQSVVDGHAQLSFASPLKIMVQANTQRALFSDLRTLTYLPDWLAGSIDARADASVLIQGALGKPHIHVQFSTQEARFAEQNVGSLNGIVDVDNLIDQRAELNGSLAQGTFKALWTADQSDKKLHLSMQQLHTQSLWGIQRLFPKVRGLVDATFDLDINEQGQHGAGELHVHNTFILDHKTPDSYALFRVTDDRVHINLEALGARIKAVGDVFLNNPYAYHLSGEWNDAQGASFFALKDFKIASLGNFNIRGLLKQLRESKGEMTWSKLDVTADFGDVFLVRPAHLVLDGQKIHLDDTLLRGKYITLNMGGDAFLDGFLDLKTQGQVDLKIFEKRVPAIKFAQGMVPFKLHLGGLFDKVTWQGQAALDNVQLGFSFLPDTLTKLQGQLIFAEDTLFLESLKARMGTGNLSGQGELHILHNELLSLLLNVDLERIVYPVFDGLSATLSGPLVLSSKRENSSVLRSILSGDLNIDEAHYTKTLSLDALLPSLRQKPSYLPEYQSLNEWLQFDIAIKGDNTIVIDNNLAKASLSADLKLVGSNLKQGLLGYVQPHQARLFFQNNIYEFESGSIEFIHRFHITPRFDVRLSTQACRADLWVTLSGTFENDRSYQLNAGGRDNLGPVSFEDARSCILMGMRTSQNAVMSGATRMGTAGLLGSGLEALNAVSGIDYKIAQYLPVDYLRFGSGYSMRLRSIIPRIMMGINIGQIGKLQLDAALVPLGDQILQFQIEWRSWALSNLYFYNNAPDVSTHIGLDVIKIRREF